MDPVIESLQPPLFLVSMPQVLDPFFNRSVVLLLEHGADGSLGIVVNRPTELSITALVTDLGIDWNGDRATPAYLGGPVQPNVGTALFSGDVPSIDPDDERVMSIASGMKLSQDVRVLTTLARTPPPLFRFILGSAGWTPGQLEEELGRNDWLIVPFDPEIVFHEPSEEAWQTALALIGVRPEALSAFTAGGDDGGAN